MTNCALVFTSLANIVISKKSQIDYQCLFIDLKNYQKLIKKINAFDNADSFWSSWYRFEIRSIYKQLIIWSLNDIEKTSSLFERLDKNRDSIQSNDRFW